MKIFYHTGEHISFQVSGAAYRNGLRELGHTLITEYSSLHKADIAIIHDDIFFLPALFKAHPALYSLYTIAIAVWENEELCSDYAEKLQLVNEIWTPSTFAQKSFLPYFPATSVVPHIVQRQKFSTNALHCARRLLGKDEAFTFFSISDSFNPRKNLPALLRAFARLQQKFQRQVRLVVKQYRYKANLEALPQVIAVDQDLTSEEIAALHAVSDAYVSTHRAEGWGLGLSEAMAYGKPVLATGYSGNMEFMDESNSFPIRYSLAPVSKDAVKILPLCHTGMYWAEIDEDALFNTMVSIIKETYPKSLPSKATQICKRFSYQNVGQIMNQLLQKIS